MRCSWPLFAPDCPDEGVHAWWSPTLGDFGLCGDHSRWLSAHQKAGWRRDAELNQWGDVAS